MQSTETESFGIFHHKYCIFHHNYCIIIGMDGTPIMTSSDGRRRDRIEKND